MTSVSLRDWVKVAEPGASMVYHVGVHAAGDICREAMQLYDAGLVSPVRRRRPINPAVFEYIAQRTRKPWPGVL